MQELDVADHDFTPTGVITKSPSYEGRHRGNRKHLEGALGEEHCTAFKEFA
jgi:hypothetical protein